MKIDHILQKHVNKLIDLGGYTSARLESDHFLIKTITKFRKPKTVNIAKDKEENRDAIKNKEGYIEYRNKVHEKLVNEVKREPEVFTLKFMM